MRNLKGMSSVVAIVIIAVVAIAAGAVFYVASQKQVATPDTNLIVTNVSVVNQNANGNTNSVSNVNSTINGNTNTTSNINTAVNGNTNTASGEDYTLTLKSRTFTPPADLQPFFDAMKAIEVKNLPSGTFHGIIQLTHIPSTDEKNLLLGIGVTLNSYLPHNAYLVSVLPATTPEQVRALGFVRSMLPLERNDKISSGILQSKKSNTIEATVRYFTDVPPDAAKQTAAARGITVIGVSAYFNRLTVSGTPSALQALADVEWVSWVEENLPPTTN